MLDFFSLTASILFLVASYVAVGLVVCSLIKRPDLALPEYFFVGAGAVAIITLLAAMFFPERLRLISLIIMAGGLVLGLSVMILKIKGRIFKPIGGHFLWYLLIAAIILPILIGTYHVRVWGDEINMEAPLVRQWLATGSFETAEDAWYGFFDYPRLWSIMLYQSLLVNGDIHEAAGRWLSIIMVFFGAVFVAQKLINRFKINRWAGWLWSCFWLALVFGPMFAWSASWYYCIAIEMLVMLTFYYALIARDTINAPLNLSSVFITGLFAGMLVGIRPDGFLYLPLLVFILLYVPWAKFKQSLKNNLIGAIGFLIPSFLVFWSWRIYTNVNNLHGDKDPFELARNLASVIHKLPAIAVEMFRLLATEWQMSGFWAFCLILSFLLYGLLYKRLDSNEKNVIWLLLVPIYKFLILIIENAVFFDDNVRLGRHIMQTAPLLYFIMGFLILKFFNEKFGNLFNNMRRSSKVFLIVLLLATVFILQVFLGSLFARLPREMNDYLESWAVKIHREYPTYTQVPLLLSAERPKATPVFELWRYYAGNAPILYEIIPLEDNEFYFQKLAKQEIDAVLLYAPDESMARSLGLKLLSKHDYLIGQNKKRFRILSETVRPYDNVWGIPFRTRAISAFVNDLNVWQ